MFFHFIQRPWILGEAVIRRFGTRIFVPKPGPLDRQQIIKLHAKDANGRSIITKSELESLAELCGGMSASEISNAIYDAKKKYISTAQQSDYFKKNKAGFYEPSSKWDPKSEPLSCEDMDRGMLATVTVPYKAVKVALEEAPKNYEDEEMKILEFAIAKKIPIDSMVATNDEGKSFLSKLICS